MVRVGIDDKLIFPNGVYVFDSKGRQLSPTVGEGKVIAEIYARQAKTREANKEQRKKFETLTGKDIDGDGKIG
jgi:hypothetical protein